MKPFYCINCLIQGRDKECNLYPQKTKKILRIISINLFNPDFNVCCLEKKAKISRQQLYEIILASFNKSPKKLITCLRLEMSLYLFENNSLKIYDISKKVGFTSMKSYRRAFICHLRTTPKEFRNKILQKNNFHKEVFKYIKYIWLLKIS